MGKSRNKKNTKQNITSKPVQSVNINLPENMSMEEMKHMIACAIIESEEIKAQKEEEQYKFAKEEWHRKIGYKKYDNIFLQFFNCIKSLKNILFLPKKDIEGDRASTAFLKSLLSTFFLGMKCITLFLGILLILYLPIQRIIGVINHFPWLTYIVFVLHAFVFLISSSLFRMLELEIDNIEDRSYLFGLFTSVTSFISIILAIVAIVKSA